eukprot:scaffold5109_cov112-Isochrysis_galbana.AAC.1
MKRSFASQGAPFLLAQHRARRAMPPASASQWKPSYDLNNFGISKSTFDHRGGKVMPRQGGIRLPERATVSAHYNPSVANQPSTVSGGMRLPPVSGPQGGYGHGRAGVAAPQRVPPLDHRDSYAGGSPGSRSPDSMIPNGGIGFGKELLEIIREMREQLAAQQRQITMLTHEVRLDVAAEMRSELEALKQLRNQEVPPIPPPGADAAELAGLRELVQQTQAECSHLRERVTRLEARPAALDFPAAPAKETKESARPEKGPVQVPPLGEVEEVDGSDADSLALPEVYEGTREAEMKAAMQAAARSESMDAGAEAEVEPEAEPPVAESTPEEADEEEAPVAAAAEEAPTVEDIGVEQTEEDAAGGEATPEVEAEGAETTKESTDEVPEAAEEKKAATTEDVVESEESPVEEA